LRALMRVGRFFLWWVYVHGSPLSEKRNHLDSVGCEYSTRAGLAEVGIPSLARQGVRPAKVVAEVATAGNARQDGRLRESGAIIDARADVARSCEERHRSLFTVLCSVLCYCLLAVWS
jgi:hypothetical protein